MVLGSECLVRNVKKSLEIKGFWKLLKTDFYKIFLVIIEV